MAPQSMPAVVANDLRRHTTATTAITAMGSAVSKAEKAIQRKAAGCITVSRKSLPASSPRQAKYIDRPSERIIKLADCVV